MWERLAALRGSVPPTLREALPRVNRPLREARPALWVRLAALRGSVPPTLREALPRVNRPERLAALV